MFEVFPPEAARTAIEETGLWVDATKLVDGTITRQQPDPGTTAPVGTEVSLYSVPLPAGSEDEGVPPVQDIEEGIPTTDDFPQDESAPRNPNQTDW